MRRDFITKRGGDLGLAGLEWSPPAGEAGGSEPIGLLVIRFQCMEYKTKTNLILPFKGTLMVSNGGRTAETNNHIRHSQSGTTKSVVLI
jgi:hypothetical protein